VSDERRLPGEPRQTDAGERMPEGPPSPDQVGREGAMGVPAQGADAVGAPPAVDDHPRTGDLSGRPEPAGAEGAVRTDLPPNVTHPDAATGWDQAVDLEQTPATIPDLAEIQVPEELRAKIEAHMAKYPDRRSAVLPALHAAQDVHGWCSPQAIAQVAAVMRVTPAYLSSIASFYDMLNEEPVGRRHVYVCTGVACIPKRPSRVLEAIAEEAERRGLHDTEIRGFECLGACDMAPMASIDGRYVGPLDPSDAPAIVEAVAAGEPPLPGRGLEDADYRLPWGGRA
jgi:NADH-quinone oxidoreductase subunit E